MNSCLYTVQVAHSRIAPRKNSFRYAMYMFYLDLDELQELNNRFKMLSYNKWNIHSFFDSDHFMFVDNDDEQAKMISSENVKFDASQYKNKNTKERIEIMLKEIGQDWELGKVYLLTSLRNYGYIFNPVSFYYCFDKQGKFRVLFSEVNNTWRQQKMYYYISKDFDQKVHRTSQAKNYYISPFIDYDTTLHWQFEVPNDKILMLIKSEKNNQLELSTSLLGDKKKITIWRLLYILWRYPLVTLFVIWRIHWQAFKLWLKKVPHFDKSQTDDRIAKAITNKKK